MAHTPPLAAVPFDDFCHADLNRLNLPSYHRAVAVAKVPLRAGDRPAPRVCVIAAAQSRLVDDSIEIFSRLRAHITALIKTLSSKLTMEQPDTYQSRYLGGGGAEDSVVQQLRLQLATLPPEMDGLMEQLQAQLRLFAQRLRAQTEYSGEAAEAPADKAKDRHKATVCASLAAWLVAACRLVSAQVCACTSRRFSRLTPTWRRVAVGHGRAAATPAREFA